MMSATIKIEFTSEQLHKLQRADFDKVWAAMGDIQQVMRDYPQMSTVPSKPFLNGDRPEAAARPPQAATQETAKPVSRVPDSPEPQPGIVAELRAHLYAEISKQGPKLASDLLLIARQRKWIRGPNDLHRLVGALRTDGRFYRNPTAHWEIRDDRQAARDGRDAESAD